MRPKDLRIRIRRPTLIILGFAALWFSGCGDSGPEPSYVKIGTPSQRVIDANRSKITQPYENELQYVVHEVASSLAEWTWYAAKGKAPTPGDIHVRISGSGEARNPAPPIHLEIKTGNTSQSIDWGLRQAWSPTEYQAVASLTVAQLGLEIPPSAAAPLAAEAAAAWLDHFLDGKNLTIESENQQISSMLQASILDPNNHEKAAVLLGLMALREDAGIFQEAHLELARATAHLAFAQAIREARKQTLKPPLARMGELLLMTGANLQAEVLRELDAQGAAAGIPPHWIRLLRVENTGDYRLLEPIQSLKPAERQSWVRAKARMTSGTVAGEAIAETELAGDVHMMRSLRTSGHSIELGHVLLREGRNTELLDFQKIYDASHKSPLTESERVSALNRIPSGAFTEEGQLRVISDGRWAMNYQRHLCNALLSEGGFLDSRLGMPEEAIDHLRSTLSSFGTLSLFAFLGHLQRLQLPQTEAQDSAKAVSFMLEHPELIPNGIWGVLSGGELRGSKIRTVPTARLWRAFEPLPGSVFERSAWRLRIYSSPFQTASTEFDPRSPYQLALVLEESRLAELHDQAPYELGLIHARTGMLMVSNAPSSEIQKVWAPLLGYSMQALSGVARAFEKEPDEYERWLLKAAQVDPNHFFRLGMYFINLQPAQRERGIKHLEKGYAISTDRVSAASYARSLVDYYLDQHRDQDAKRIAEDAASTYSAAGLAAMGHYCERTRQVDEAVKWFEKIDRRYEGHREVLFLALRILSDEGDPKVVARFRSVVQTFRPKTLIPVKVAELTASPALGVQFGDDSPLLTAHGLKKGDVIVAVYGFRVENATEYAVLRESTPQTNLVVIVWDGKGYREIDANLPNRRFGAMVQDYTPQ